MQAFLVNEQRTTYSIAATRVALRAVRFHQLVQFSFAEFL